MCNSVEENVELRLKFQVADVHKPLIAVRRLVEKGNRVVFGPDMAENYPVALRASTPPPCLGQVNKPTSLQGNRPTTNQSNSIKNQSKM